MATTTTPVAATTTKAKERRTWTARYGVAGKDAFEVRLERRRDGSWRTFGRHVQGSGKARKAARGATEAHASEKDARAAFERLQAAAAKAGWVRRESRGGYSARPDAFTIATLPKASK